jgi:hypothetical protein
MNLQNLSADLTSMNGHYPAMKPRVPQGIMNAREYITGAGAGKLDLPRIGPLARALAKQLDPVNEIQYG